MQALHGGKIFNMYLILYEDFDLNSLQFFQPERIDPKGDLSNYDIRSDVWSFGISMIEISTGEYPYKMWKTPFEQLRQVVQEDPPKLPANKFTPEYEDFINRS